MPRKRQAPQTAGLEAGAAYGEVSENLQAQDPSKGGVPLPGGSRPVPTSSPQPSANVATTPQGQVMGVAAPPATSLEAARNYQPNVTPLAGPDNMPEVDITAGLQRHLQSPEDQMKALGHQRAIALMERFAVSTNDSQLFGIVTRLKATHRGTR